MPDYKYVRNKPESGFLTGQAEYSRSRERLGSCLASERSMMKSSTLFHEFECGPLPPYVHLTSTSRPPDVIHVVSVPRPSPFFAALPPPCIILNANRRTKNGVGLGTRLQPDLEYPYNSYVTAVEVKHSNKGVLTPSAHHELFVRS